MPIETEFFFQKALSTILTTHPTITLTVISLIVIVAGARYVFHSLLHIIITAGLSYYSADDPDPWLGNHDLRPQRYEIVLLVNASGDRRCLVQALQPENLNPEMGVSLEYHFGAQTRVVVAGFDIDRFVNELQAKLGDRARIRRLSPEHDLTVKPLQAVPDDDELIPLAFCLHLTGRDIAQGIQGIDEIKGPDDPLHGALRSFAQIPTRENEAIVIQIQIVNATRTSRNLLRRQYRRVMHLEASPVAVVISRFADFLTPTILGPIANFWLWSLDRVLSIKRSDTPASRRIANRMDSPIFNATVAVSALVRPDASGDIRSTAKGYPKAFIRSGSDITVKTRHMLLASKRILYRLLRIRTSTRISGEQVLTAQEITTLFGPLGAESGVSNRITTSHLTLPSGNVPKNGSAIAQTNHELPAQRKKIRISDSDLSLHGRALGRTGMGKSSLQVALAQGLMRGKTDAGDFGLCVIDPKRSVADSVLATVPDHRTRDVLIIDPGDIPRRQPPALNLMVCQDWLNPEDHARVISTIIEKRFSSGWGPRMAPLFRNAMLALIWANKRLIESGMDPRYTLFDLSHTRFFATPDGRFAGERERILDHLHGEPRCDSVLQFWEAFDMLPAREQEARTQPVVNKISAVDSPATRSVFGHSLCEVDFMDCMENGKIVLLNLSKAVFKGDSGDLFGTIILALILQAAIVRYDRNAKAPQQKELRPFALLVDEVQNFLCPEMEEILTEGRAYACPLWIAHQDTSQIKDLSLAEAMENAATQIYFRLTPKDAASVASHLGAPFSRENLTSTPKFNFVAELPDTRVTGETFPLPKRDFRKLERLKNLSEASYLSRRKISGNTEIEGSNASLDSTNGFKSTSLPDLPEDLESWNGESD